MNDEKSKDQLIRELHELEEKYNSLKSELDNDEKSNKTNRFLQQITERSRTNEALIKSEMRHQTILQTAMDGYWMTDLEGKFIEVNEAYCNMSGYTETELLTMSVLDVEVLENNEETKIHIEKLIENGNERFITKHRRKDGSIYDVEVSSVYQQEFENTFVVFIRDITEQNRFDKALKDSELRFKVLFEDAPDAMLLADPETRKIIDANNNACKLFKKTKHELIGLFQYELHPPQNIDYSKNTFKEQFENRRQSVNNEPVENKICCSDGTEIPVEIIGQAIQLNGKSLMLGTFRDITERKKVEEELKVSEEKFAIAFKTSPYAITITRPEDGKFIEVNDAFFSMTGYSPEEALNNSSIGMDLWFDAENRNNVLKVLRVGGAINGQEFQFKKKNGEIITGLFSAQLIDINNNTFILSSINDITEQKLAQEKLRDSEMRFRQILQDVESLSVQGYAPDGTTQYWNKASERLYGYTAEEAIGKNFTDLIIPSEMRDGV
ncbi:MAG: PAS domain-containing protein, partial [Paludibacter sp.]